MIQKILEEDSRRRARRDAQPPYNPVAGDPADPERVKQPTPVADLPEAYIPRQMVDDPQYPLVQRDERAWKLLRFRHDFPYWCVECVRIKPKTGYRDVPFTLNSAQRRVLAILEEERRAGRPIRLILLKARQWGGSTLVQVYMAWIQMIHRPNWHSLIVSQSMDTSATVRAMFDKLLASYPEQFWEGDKRPCLKTMRGSANTMYITGRECRVTVASALQQDSMRGSDIAMAHLTEVAFWPDTPRRSPDDLLRAVCGSVALEPYTVVVFESTANGVGNFFHREWLRCRDGGADMRTAFVPWYEIDMYRREPDDAAALAASLDEYEKWLFDALELCLDQICWYRAKRREMTSHQRMMAEYPTTDDEAFAATSYGVFARRAVEALRSGCRPGLRGEVDSHLRWADDPCGAMELWEQPAPGGEYLVAVDVGGRTEKADWSVIAVMRLDGERPEVVAQWRGHIDHDLLASTACRIATFYGEALLVVESNSLEGGIDSSGAFILERLARDYRNLYFREAGDECGAGTSARPGFHTNRRTKAIAVATLVEAVREGRYVERSVHALDEMLTYEITPEGVYAAKAGCHDDIVMTRAIALTVAATRPAAAPLAPPMLRF